MYQIQILRHGLTDSLLLVPGVAVVAVLYTLLV
nr:MAG TPA: hypothetical protein [Caudoviricetes sp.]